MSKTSIEQADDLGVDFEAMNVALERQLEGLAPLFQGYATSAFIAGAAWALNTAPATIHAGLTREWD